MTLVEQVWKKVDEDMLALMQPGPNTDFASLKARLRAFAEVLAIFMIPHFTTADEVAREAKRRYDNRLDETYCTAGLNVRRYEAPPGTKNVWEKPEEVNKLTVNLPQATIDQIKNFSQHGFPNDALAKAHGVSIKVIEQVLRG